MEKKTKEAFRRYKRSINQSSSSSSSGSDSSSSSSSSSGKKTIHRKEKKQRNVNAHRRSRSSSSDQRRKREKQHACQKKLEAKRNHIKRKLKEAKLKKRAAAAAAALCHTGSLTSSHRALSPTQQQKMKKLAAAAAAEKKHLRAMTKEGLREREKLRAAAKEREHTHSTKTTKIRIHQDVKHKSPVMVGRHQLSPREKIIIQTRAHRTPPERKRDLKIRRDESRERREAARNKEREEALARCQERQRERERIAREKLRREEEKKYERSDRLLPRPVERELAIAAARSGYGSRERSLDSEGHPRHGHSSRSGRDTVFEEHEYLSSEEIRRREILERENRREREYLAVRHRDVLSPVYSERIRDDQILYPLEERERSYTRGYVDGERHRERDWDRELDFVSKIYPSEREREWPPIDQWDERAYVSRSKIPPRAASEHDWDVDELAYSDRGDRRQPQWDDRDRGKHVPSADRSSISGNDRRWQEEWCDARSQDPSIRNESRAQVSYRRGGCVAGTNTGSHKDYAPERQGYRVHPPPLMAQPVGLLNFQKRFPSKRQMTYTNPNLVKKQQTTMVTTPGKPSAPASETVTPTSAPSITSSSEFKPQNSDAALIAQAANADDQLFPDDDDDEEAAKKLAENNQELEAGEIISFSDAENKHVSIKKEQSDSLSETRADEETISKSILTSDSYNETLVISKEPKEPTISNETNKESLAQKLEIKEEVKYSASESFNPSTDNHEEQDADDLSEISDSEDDILDKEEPLSSNPTVANLKTEKEVNECNMTKSIKGNLSENVAVEQQEPILSSECGAEKATINDDDDLLDFEEISDGELEEDSRVKSVGDALGVDWESLIKDAKTSSVSLGEETTTAKQKWQSHHIILDVGISMKMAGKDYAKRLLNDAKQKLDEELGHIKIKSEIKDENKDDSNTKNNIVKEENDDKKFLAIAVDKQKLKPLNITNEFNVDSLSPIACVQVSRRIKCAERSHMISNACGPNSRALSARQDLKLRRQLCGLPAKEGDFPRTVSDKMKAIAIAAFQRSLEVK